MSLGTRGDKEPRNDQHLTKINNLGRLWAEKLTFISTRNKVPSECLLKPVTSRRVIERRKLFASEEVAALLSDTEVASRAGFPDAHAKALIIRYLAGQTITMSLGGASASYVEFERLANHEEVWVISFRNASRQQWRFFGRFVELDRFFALLARDRNELRGRKYDQAAKDFIARWDRCFPGTPIVKGTHWTDYVSGPARDICDNDDDSF